ncbi:MAG: OmpA family protein [Geminicoccaceae bacterium]|nr:OmpA family protein [Geminicoccaceae bacterium]
MRTVSSREIPPDRERFPTRRLLHKRVTVLSTGAAMLLALAAVAPTATPSWAADVYMFSDAVPTAEEIAAIMFPAAADEASPETPAPPPQIRTRGIRFTTPAPTASSGEATAKSRWDKEVAAADGAATPAPQGSIVGFNITFAYNSAELSREAVPYLDRLGEALRLPAAEGKAIRIGGHADASGPEDYNQRLSQARAASVRDYLENRHGIAPSRLQVVGYGESAPLPGTDPFAGVNRRVEFEPLN